MDAATLRIRLLGGFSVETDGAMVPERAWRLRKARALVKVAALAPGRRVHRDVLCELLWPDRDASAAANNLHQALHAARRAIGDAGALALQDDVLTLSAAAWTDVDAFEAAAHDGDPEAALALYGGDLLPEDRFEEWTAARRAALAELRLDLCVRAAERLRARGDPAAAVSLLGALVAGAPRHEPLRRAHMRALAAAGRRQDALAQFEELRDALRAHAEADPDPETRALYRELLAAAAPEAPARAGLPHALTSFVGRERELHELERLLDRARLVTLTGPGGAGKTRLALAAAARRAPRLPGGAWLTDLGALREPALVPQAVATALGVPIPANRPALDALAAHVAGQPGMLLVLDTCEHLLDACAHLAEALLGAAPAVRLLATSREPLRCAAEVAWRVPSLAEAPALFRERAAAVRGEPLRDEEAAAIDEICWRLDRMPLAIELAAARTGALTVGQLAARLGDSLDMLSAGRRTALSRQATLRATIGWSHDLLTADERVVFRRLAVFAGGFTLEAAETVVAGGPIPERRVADLVGRLVEKSLVVGEAGRFRLMDTIAQFAGEQLQAAHERDAVGARHLEWCLERARAHDPLAGDGGALPLRGLEDIDDDLRAGLAFALRHDPQTALALATHLWRFWLAHSLFVEGTGWLDAVLDAAPQPTTVRVEALLAAAGMALRRGAADAYLERVGEAVTLLGDLDDSRATAEAFQQHAIFEEYVRSSALSARLFRDAVATAERLGEQRIATSARHASAMTPWNRSDLPAARTRLRDAIVRLRALPPGRERFLQAITLGLPVLPEGTGGARRMVWEATVFQGRRLDRDSGLALALCNLALVERSAGDLDAADTALAEALPLCRANGDATSEALTLAHLGHAARMRGDLETAADLLADAVRRMAELGEHRDADVLCLGLGLVQGARGDLAPARTTFASALDRFLATDDVPGIAGTRSNWAIVEERAGELERARDLYAESAASWQVQRLDRFAGWPMLACGQLCHALGEHEAGAAALHAARAALAGANDAGGVAEADAWLAAQGSLSDCKEGAT
jgi:predicted ATPase/DNA-binding SARP family transcriptional activator